MTGGTCCVWTRGLPKSLRERLPPAAAAVVEMVKVGGAVDAAPAATGDSWRGATSPAREAAALQDLLNQAGDENFPSKTRK